MRPKILLVGVYTPRDRVMEQDYYFQEFLNLVKTLGLEYDQTHFIKLRYVDKNNFLTKGKLEDLAQLCKDEQIEEVVLSELLSPVQERNLEDTLECPVFDREKLILEIFKKAAKTSEGKIQVEMAEIDYLKTRIIGKGKEYAQQAGFIGGRGPGEMIKEEIRRHFDEKLRQAKKKLVTLQKSRDVQRKQRLRRNIPLACIIGYTNAGKSSLLNCLVKSDVLAEDKLFATLDTTTREYFIAPKRTVLISDTVGFISQLPHHLIDAFKSTLDELQYASLLFHVIDCSNPAYKSQIEVVKEILHELHVEKPMVYVFNKIDKLTKEELEKLKTEVQEYEPRVFVHTRSPEGIVTLGSFIKNYKF